MKTLAEIKAVGVTDSQANAIYAALKQRVWPLAVAMYVAQGHPEDHADMLVALNWETITWEDLL